MAAIVLLISLLTQESNSQLLTRIKALESLFNTTVSVRGLALQGRASRLDLTTAVCLCTCASGRTACY